MVDAPNPFDMTESAINEETRTSEQDRGTKR